MWYVTLKSPRRNELPPIRLLLHQASPKHRWQVPRGRQIYPGLTHRFRRQSARGATWTGPLLYAKLLCPHFLTLATQMMTMDHDSSRVNVHVDKAGNVLSVRHG